MNNRRNILKLTLGAAGLLVLPQAIELAKATEDFIKGPRVQDIEPTKISQHVWFVRAKDSFPTPDNQGMMANVTFVVTSKGVVILDSGASVQIGEMVIRAIKKVTPLPVIAIFNSHYHGDHFLGNQAFIEAFNINMPIYAHPYTQEKIKKIEGNTWLNLMERWTNQASAGTALFPPTHTVKHGDIFDYGNVKLKVHHYGQAHTFGDICIEVIEDKVTHVGDIAMDNRIANMDDGSYVGTFKTYKALETSCKDCLWMPAHGNPKKTLLKEYGEFFAGIYESSYKAVQEGKDPSTAKQLVLKDPRVAKHIKTMQGFEANIGKYSSIAYLEAEKEAF